MSKKTIILIIIGVLIGAYLCFWTAAQIYNHYNPPSLEDCGSGNPAMTASCG